VIQSREKRVVLFEDETGFSMHPKLGRIWVKKGTQPYVETRSQHGKRLNLFGWVDPLNGFHGLMKSIKGDTCGFLKLLKKILTRFKGKIIDLWADNARWHKGQSVYSFLLEERRLNIHYLPPYHPELNYQETLWRTMRYEETTNVYFETVEDLTFSVFKRSQKWKPQKIKSLCKLI
jgi:transposase